MTEITAENGWLRRVLERQALRETYVIDPLAFFVALLAAPLAVAAATFFLIVPVAAVIFGGPLYLLIGTPVLLWHLGRHPAGPGRIAGVALVSYVICAVPVAVYAALTMSSHSVEGFLLFACFGLIFAPLWGAVFGLFYRNLRREVFARPI